MRPLINNPTIAPVLPRSQNHQVVHTTTLLYNSIPKSHQLESELKSQAQETEEHPFLLITTAKSTDRVCHTGHSSTVSNPKPTYLYQAQVQQAQTQQQ